MRGCTVTVRGFVPLRLIWGVSPAPALVCICWRSTLFFRFVAFSFNNTTFVDGDLPRAFLPSYSNVRLLTLLLVNK